MNEQDIRQLINTGLPGSQVEITAEGDRLCLTVTSEAFAGLAPVKRQQLVYACIMELITGGEIHAVTIRALTLGEQSSDKGQQRHA